MARIDMIRSYLEKLAAAAFPEASIANGTATIRFGSVSVFVRAMDQDPDTVAVSATIAENVPATPRLFEWLNEVNIRYRDVKVMRFERGSVQAHVYLRTDDISQASLTTAVTMVGQFADQVDDQLVASLGGNMTNPS